MPSKLNKMTAFKIKSRIIPTSDGHSTQGSKYLDLYRRIDQSKQG